VVTHVVTRVHVLAVLLGGRGQASVHVHRVTTVTGTLVVDQGHDLVGERADRLAVATSTAAVAAITAAVSSTVSSSAAALAVGVLVPGRGRRGDLLVLRTVVTGGDRVVGGTGGVGEELLVGGGVGNGGGDALADLALGR